MQEIFAKELEEPDICLENQFALQVIIFSIFKVEKYLR